MDACNTYFSNNYLNELKATIVHLQVALSRNAQHVEFSQMIYRANPLPGLYTPRASSERYFRKGQNWYYKFI